MENRISAFLVRCPRRLRDGLAALADREGKNRSEVLRDLIRSALEGDNHDPDNQPPPRPPLALAA